MRRVLLGIDLGTAVLKVCAVDARRRSVCAAAERCLTVKSPSPGEREQRPGDVLKAFREAAGEVRAALGGDWRGVEGIGLAAQGGSSILADRASGKPLTPMILWNDGRAQGQTAALAGRHPESFWKKHLLNTAPPAGLGRLLWMREAWPDRFREDTIHIGAGEFLFHQLTGVWRQDAGNAIQIGSYGAARKKLIPDLLDLVDVPLDFVAPLRKGHETAPLGAHGAKWLDLPKGVPVAGPYIDQEAAYLAAAAGGGSPLQCSLGTAWVGNYRLPAGCKAQSPTQLALPSPAGDGFLMVQPLLTGNLTWEWGLRMAGGGEPLPFERAAALFRKAPLPAGGLTLVPWLAQANPLNAESAGGGLLHGLSPEHDGAELLRAAAAGMCCELARVFGEIKAGNLISKITLGGGTGRSRHIQTAAAALFAPLETEVQTEPGLSAARGSLYAFDREAARSPAVPVKPPAADDAGRMAEYFHHYLSVFEAHYSGIPAGAACRAKGKPR